MGLHQQKVIIICTVDNNFGTSRDDSVPWDICENNVFFESKVKGNVVVMGRKMWFSNPNKYPNSINYILSENTVASGVCHGGIAELNKLMKKHPTKDIYIVGGPDIFQLYMYSADQIIMTRIKIDYKCDKFFPVLNENYEITSCKPDMFSQEENCFYERIYYKQSEGVAHPEYKFTDLCKDLIENGDYESDTKIQFINAKTLIFDTNSQFPLFTTVYTDFKTVLSEVISCLNGNGDIGFNWRFFGAKFSELFEETEFFNKKEVYGGVDQLKTLDSLIIHNPADKNLILTCCNPLEPSVIDNVCHFYTVGRYMSLIVTVPKIQVLKINKTVAFYSILLYIFSSRAGKSPDKIFFNFGKIYIKEHQKTEMNRIIEETPRPFPVLILDKVVRYKKIEDLNSFDFTLVGYTHTSKKFKRCPFIV